MRIQGCGSSNWRRVISFSILSFVREKITEKINFRSLCSYFCPMPLHLLYRFSKFLVSTERQSGGGGCGAAIEEPPHGSAQNRCTSHRPVHSVTDCHYYTNSSSCYLNVNYSTPVFTSYAIIMCN
jgi:hypothetical protein